MNQSINHASRSRPALSERRNNTEGRTAIVCIQVLTAMALTSQKDFLQQPKFNLMELCDLPQDFSGSKTV